MGDEKLLATYQKKIDEGLARAQEDLNYWQSQTPEGMFSEDRKDPLFRDLEKIAKMTGLVVEDTVNHSYGVVIDREHEMFGQVGLFVSSDSRFSGRGNYKFGRKRVSLDNDQVYAARNVTMVLQERRRVLNSSLFEVAGSD